MQKFMLCTTCKNMVLMNDVQVCLSCQRGFIGVPQEDDSTNYTIAQLKKREDEINGAIQEREAAGLSVREQPRGGTRVRGAHAKGKKASPWCC